MSDGGSSYRLIYLSKSNLHGPAVETEAEVNRILDASRRNNARDGITGALLFSDSCFAQVLEGRSEVIHAVFERIQLDPRHRDTVVLGCERAEREFGGWSMAYAGPATREGAPYGHLALQDPGGAASGRVLEVLRGVVRRQHAEAPAAG